MTKNSEILLHVRYLGIKAVKSVINFSYFLEAPLNRRSETSFFKLLLLEFLKTKMN